MSHSFPRARYVVLSSRLVPGLDGGFTVATLARARHMAAAGVEGGRGPLLLSVDPGSADDHARHREEFVATGAAASVEVFRNLFDELRADASWLWDAARPGAADDGSAERRGILDADGREIASIPVVAGDEWFLTDAPVVVRDPAGAEEVRHVRGFGGLYRAWLDHVVSGLVDADADIPVVVVCESRQLGLLLADWANPRARVVHTIHTSHLEPPYTPDAPVNALWARWFARMGSFDAVLWPTLQQRQDVEARFGAPTVAAVVPNAAPPAREAPAAVRGDRGVVVTRLVPLKRVADAIRAWALAVEVVPGATLDVYGDGPQREELQREIDERGLSELVVLRGRIDWTPDVFDGAALTLQTSRYEGQGLAPLEALSRGCPVIAYDARYGPRDRAAVGGDVLVEDGSVEDLAAAIVGLLGDEDARRLRAESALECARAYSAEAVMNAMARVVADVVAAPPRRQAPRRDPGPHESGASDQSADGSASPGTIA